MAIVTTHYRYKRPPRKRKPAEIEGAGDRAEAGRADAVVPPDRVEEPAPGNDNRPEAAISHHEPKRSAIVTTTSKKQLKLMRADKRAPTTDSDPEMRAWLLRAMQGGWPRDD